MLADLCSSFSFPSSYLLRYAPTLSAVLLEVAKSCGSSSTGPYIAMARHHIDEHMLEPSYPVKSFTCFQGLNDSLTTRKKSNVNHPLPSTECFMHAAMSP